YHLHPQQPPDIVEQRSMGASDVHDLRYRKRIAPDALENRPRISQPVMRTRQVAVAVRADVLRNSGVVQNLQSGGTLAQVWEEHGSVAARHAAGYSQYQFDPAPLPIAVCSRCSPATRLHRYRAIPAATSGHPTSRNATKARGWTGSRVNA